MSKSGKDKTFRPRTVLIHAGRDPMAHFGAVNPPIYRASTILHPTVEALEGKKQPYTYGRRGTPTSKALEDAITELAGGAVSVLTPSGLSAVAVAVMAVVGAGDHVLMCDAAYEPSCSLVLRTLRRFGVEMNFYSPTVDRQGLEQLIRDKTKAIFVESPGSLTFEMQDIPMIASAAKARGAAVIADNTWASPLLCRPLSLGADLSIEAGTKHIVGHADASIGIVTANADWAEKLKATHGALGMCAGPDDIYLAQRGLRTLGVRLAQHEANARALIAWLRKRPEVEKVLYPGLEDDPGHALWRRDFSGACGLFGVCLRPMSKPALAAMLDGLELFGMGYSWGGYESLIVPAHPHRAVKPYTGEGPLLRIHAGLEDADDLIADLDAGFARAKAAT
jgi:cystathionine beta-lyase